MQKREYLEIEAEQGKWYVVNWNPILDGLGVAPIGSTTARNSIVAGPFETNGAAQAWIDEQPFQHKLGAHLWLCEV